MVWEYTVAASRLIGYQILPCFRIPYKHASTAIATAPASPPLIPAATGYVSSGSSARGKSGAISRRATAGRDVLTDTGASTTGTSTCFSCGKTLRNHATQPTTARIAPRIESETLVMTPAKSSAIPNASVMGHAVGAGNLITEVAV